MDMDAEKRETLVLMMEFSEWKNGIIDYLAKHKKEDMWKCYREIIPSIPDYLQLMLFLECIYTQQDIITEEQYEYFTCLCQNEPVKSIEIRNFKNSDHKSRFLDEYITVYRGEHGLSDTAIGCEHMGSMNVSHGISWTYEQSVAGFFAVRTQSDDCRIYTAKVHKSDILLIYDRRHEAEVIIKPMCIGTKLLDLKEEIVKPRISIMRKFYEYRDAERNKYNVDYDISEII